MHVGISLQTSFPYPRLEANDAIFVSMKRWFLRIKSKPETPAESPVKESGEPPTTSGKGGLRHHSVSEPKGNV